MEKKLKEAINQQINAELWSAYLYLSMSAHFAADGKPGIANWFMVQFKEEQDHALKFFNYLVARNEAPILLPIDKVETKWASPLAAFEDTLVHEKKVTAMINNIYGLSVESKDYAAQSFMEWYVNEQVEEEENARTLIDALKMIGDNGFGLYQFDKELAARVYTPIAVTSEE